MVGFKQLEVIGYQGSHRENKSVGSKILWEGSSSLTWPHLPRGAALLPSVQTLALSLLKTDTHRKVRNFVEGGRRRRGREKELEKALGKKSAQNGKAILEKNSGVSHTLKHTLTVQASRPVRNGNYTSIQGDSKFSHKQLVLLCVCQNLCNYALTTGGLACT